MSARGWRRIAAAGWPLLAVVLGLLLVQHLRHGWPFSLHHAVTAERAATAPAQPGRAEPSHARAPVEVDPARLDLIGVRLERVRRQTIAQPFRAVATVVPDESRVSHVHTRVAGWIDRLYVKTTGETVRQGQALAGIFSQELLASQSELLALSRGAAQGPPSVVLEGARARLKVLGMNEAEIRAIERAGEPRRLVTVSAPQSGVVIHRGVSVGTAVDPSTEILTIADLTRVWVLAEVPEAEIPSVARDMPATLDFPASGLAPLEARVDFLYPTLSERTRTLRVRFVVANGDGRLRPGLYGSAEFRVTPRDVLAVPRDAVVDTGDMQHVFVVEGEGRFVPRMVQLGSRVGDAVEVREGLALGETIVASGVFLIDSESRLRASGGAGMGHAHRKQDEGETPAETPPEQHHH